jgi:phospholipid/cholesterol/gamma-HCH transport system substrate-binding protein
VRPVNLLGEKYIDLDVGDQTHPLPSGSTIPRSRTSSPTELDDVLNTLDPGTRAGLRIMINEAGLGMAGRGANFNAVLEDLPPALDQARRVVGEVARENQALDRLIVRGDRVVASVDGRRDELGQLVGSAGDALGVVAERRRELGQTVRVAPAAFGRLAATLGRVRGAADQLTPAARDLRATAPALAATLARAPAFAKDAQATLAEARDVAPALSRLGRRSTPILKRLEPTAARLADFSAGARKLLDAADQGQGLSKFLDFMNGWVGVIGNADGLGHVFRLRLTFDDQFFTSAIRRYLGEYGAGKRRSPKAQAVRQALEQVQHTLDEHRDKLPEAVRRRLPKQAQELPAQVTKALGDALGGATGSTPQTGDLAPVLDYMLGS